jgi:shikimate kinase
VRARRPSVGHWRGFWRGTSSISTSASSRWSIAASPPFWLQVPIALALSRCEGGTIRPLLRDPVQAETLYHARLPAYRRAPLRLEAAGMSPEEAAERIAALL